ncbi:hypothetical protein G9C85_13705 [Halorubellus sp. JP-L1]|uniref:hypothetical protein n=1 Tax=Halorubellus sp. JP-L1 TaxID=2715753 RepID=UPI001407C575|nr:hypothetical protein [Halorubellus sp. JP-L1]NHN42677.1 hypothetical protein [Halorubellus sp. JP-L1]
MIPLQAQETLIETTPIGIVVLLLSLGITAAWLYSIYNYEPNSRGKPTDKTS